MHEPGQSSSKHRSRSVDYGEAVSFIALGLASVNAEKLAGMEGDAARRMFEKKLWRASTVAALARYARISGGAWVERPFHCLLLRRLLGHTSGKEIQEQYRIERTARVFSMVHFGVDVSPTWFGRLRRIVAQGLATESDLQRLLRSTCVLWRPSNLGRFQSSQAMPWWVRLLTLGCPKDGELSTRQPSKFLKALVLVCLMFFLICIGIGLEDLLTRSVQQGRVLLASGTASILLVFGLAAWGLWIVGPQSWRRAKLLARLLDQIN